MAGATKAGKPRHKATENVMLSPTALLWTQIIAAFGWLLVSGLAYGLWKTVRDKSAGRYWSVVQGKITISKAGVSPTHPSRHDAADTGAIIRYHYRVGDKDHEGDGARIGGKSRTMGLLAKALLKQYPEGREVEVYYDPADPARSSLEQRGKASLPTTIVFLVVFAAISAILTAHAIVGKMIMMSNGLPMFTLILPSVALLVAACSFAAYFVARRERKASASWPTTQGKIVVSKVVRDEETVEEEDSNGRTETRTEIMYRPEIRFAYRVGDSDYSAETWKPGGTVSYGTPKRAVAAVARYTAGQNVAVHYDPARPDVAVLEPNNREGAAMPLVFGVVFGLAGVLFMWLMTHGHWVNAATGT
jgi:Protein of unknown function (DUF3592)